MSVHLPECLRATSIDPGYDVDCICDRLRACEARVRDEYRWLINKSATVVDETLDAARDAVAALPHDVYCATRDENFPGKRCNCPHDDALAAIDALRGES